MDRTYLQSIVDGAPVSHLRAVVSRLHVASCEAQVEEAVKAALGPLVAAAERDELAAQALAACVEQAQEYHRQNAELYHYAKI